MTETTIRRVKPIKASTLQAKAERYRDGFVKLFREYEGAQVLTEDGEIAKTKDGRRVFVTGGWFAREMGIPKATFHQWLNGRSVRNANPDDDVDDDPVIPDDVSEIVCTHVLCPIHGSPCE